MGDLYAFDAVTGKLKGTGTRIKEYYLSILQTAFPGLLLEHEPDLAQYQIADKPAILNQYSLIPTFYIKGDPYKARDEQSVRERIAEEENKYYYGWRENGLEDIKTEDGTVILEKLTRVNALIYHNIVFKLGNQRTTYDNHWNAQFNALPPTVPILILTLATARQEGMYPYRYFAVCLNEKALPFFLDTDEEKNFYQYQKLAGAYKITRTKHFTYPPFDKIPSKADLDYKAEWRFTLGLWNYRQILVNKKEQGSDGKPLKSRNLFNAIPSLNNDEYFYLNLTVAQKMAAQEFAENYASLLPGNFKCFYYKDPTEELQGFLSSVNIGEGRRGSGGYAMRADKVSEVNYLWKFNANIEAAVQPMAILLSHLLGLEYSKKLDTNANIPDDYFPTNWPVNSQVSNQSTPVQINNSSWFFYIKNFKGPDQQSRRNKPADPAPPRISGAQYPPYRHKFDHKGNGPELNNRSFRIWKKGDVFAGVLLGDGTAVERASAGSVMASALSDFNFYEPAGFPKSSLSATKFVQYLVEEDVDPTANDQWLKDNRPIMVAKLTTDQEWCHLLGHGDGGPEELGNFVAGSKHCNTEQLAIEVGLRRITHNEELPKKIKENFTAKITAYLLPNLGAWVDQEFTEVELRNKFGLAEQQLIVKKGKRKSAEENDPIDEQVFQEWRPKFFLDIQGLGTYKLKDSNALADSFKALSETLKAPANTQKKVEAEILKRKSLFQFRQNLERYFFQYLPIGRWMRYKIFYKGEKIFEHIYDAQSQSFNYHEAQILDYTVERVLYQALEKYEKTFQLKTDGQTEDLSFWRYYKRKIDGRVVDLVPEIPNLNDPAERAFVEVYQAFKATL